MSSTFEDRIRKNRQKFAPSFHVLGDFLLDSYPQAALMTATELAHHLDLDPGTVVRFAQKLGYQGYPGLQKDLRKKLKDELLEISLPSEDDSNPADAAFSAAARCLELTRRSFSLPDAEQIVDKLDRCERVLLLAEGMAVPAALNLSFWLSAAGYTVQTAGDNPVEMARLLTGAHPKDLVFAIEVAPNSPFLMRALKSAQDLGLNTTAIVAAPSSQVADFADTALTGHATSQTEHKQVMVETIVHILIRILRQARPLRFNKSSEKSSDLSKKLITGESLF